MAWLRIAWWLGTLRTSSVLVGHVPLFWTNAYLHIVVIFHWGSNCHLTVRVFVYSGGGSGPGLRVASSHGVPLPGKLSQHLPGPEAGLAWLGRPWMSEHSALSGASLGFQSAWWWLERAVAGCLLLIPAWGWGPRLGPGLSTLASASWNPMLLSLRASKPHADPGSPQTTYKWPLGSCPTPESWIGAIGSRVSFPPRPPSA